MPQDAASSGERQHCVLSNTVCDSLWTQCSLAVRSIRALQVSLSSRQESKKKTPLVKKWNKTTQHTLLNATDMWDKSCASTDKLLFFLYSSILILEYKNRFLVFFCLWIVFFFTLRENRNQTTCYDIYWVWQNVSRGLWKSRGACLLLVIQSVSVFSLYVFFSLLVLSVPMSIVYV